MSAAASLAASPCTKCCERCLVARVSQLNADGLCTKLGCGLKHQCASSRAQVYERVTRAKAEAACERAEANCCHLTVDASSLSADACDEFSVLLVQSRQSDPACPGREPWGASEGDDEYREEQHAGWSTWNGWKTVPSSGHMRFTCVSDFTRCGMSARTPVAFTYAKYAKCGATAGCTLAAPPIHAPIHFRTRARGARLRRLDGRLGLRVHRRVALRVGDRGGGGGLRHVALGKRRAAHVGLAAGRRLRRRDPGASSAGHGLIGSGGAWRGCTDSGRALRQRLPLHTSARGLCCAAAVPGSLGHRLLDALHAHLEGGRVGAVGRLGFGHHALSAPRR
eukprot:7380075-Prymnesium_polylepis.2